MLQLPFFQVTLPLMATFIGTIWLASWSQNKRQDEISKRLDDIIQRLGRIEALVGDHSVRIGRLEERTSPLAR